MHFPWKRAESDLEREIAHHLHELASEYERQGHSREEAMRLAKREFGGSERFKEQCRDERRWAWLSTLRQDLVFGLRMMRRTPMVTAGALLSLALGIGANTAIVSLMDIVLWRDLPVPRPEQLTLVHWQAQGFPRELADSASGSMMRREGVHVADFFSYPAFQALQKNVAGRASLVAFTYPDQVSVSFAGRPAVADRRSVSGGFLAILQVRPQLGRLLSDSDDTHSAPATAVLSHRFWARTLGSERGVIGKTISIDSRPHLIVGVLEPGFYGLFPGDATEVYTPLHHGTWVKPAHARRSPLQDERYWGVSLIARLAPDVTPAQLRSLLDGVFPNTWSRPPKDASRTPRIRLDPGRRGLGFLRQEFRNPLLVLGGLVGLLLAIACTNIANLLLARATARQREVATRLSLGCGRGRLMRQFLTESALLALLGGAGSVAVAYLTANLLGQFLAGRETLPIVVALDFRILSTAGATTAVALLLFGLLPAWRASQTPNAFWLGQGARGVGYASRRNWSAGRVLILAQIGMSIVLVMTAVIFTRNLASIQSSDPGFDRRNLILFGIRPGTSGYDKAQLLQFYFDVEQRLAAAPGVSGVGIARSRPMNIGGWWETLKLAGQTETYNASINGVTPSYLPVYTRGMAAGRNISWADIRSEAKVAVISEDLAQKLGGTGVLGRRLAFAGQFVGNAPPEFEIVGIAPAIAATSMKDRPYAMWVPLAKDVPDATVVVRTSQPPYAVLPAIRQALGEIDRNLPMVDAITMEEQISKVLQRERMFATLCGGFGILAVVLAVVGLYGVMAYSTSRRRGEIGLRLALGAVPGQVLWMFLREGMALAALGMLMGVPIVWLGAKYVEKELFQMKPLEPVSLSLTLGILLAAALVAVGIPAVRASTVQPAETLRQD